LVGHGGNMRDKIMSLNNSENDELNGYIIIGLIIIAIFAFVWVCKTFNWW
jgi:hypothetical protein